MYVRMIYLPHRLGLVNFSEGTVHPLVSTIQNQLSSRGFYQAKEHGMYDSETQEAVTAFQSAEGLRSTGIVTPLTYCRLQTAVVTEVTPITARTRTSTALPRANILITKTTRQLTLFDGNTPMRQYPVGIGKPGTPTPVGNYSIASKVLSPGGVLGSRWLGLNYDTYGIHGTNADWLIGKMVSHGCIRMHNAHVEELFVLINIGTPVYIRD